MKKVFLNCMLLLCALIVGSNSLWADDPSWSHEFASPDAISNNSITVDGATWTVSTVVGAGSPTISAGNSYQKYCLKFGTGSKNCFSSVTFSTDYFKDYNVKSVTIKVLHNASQSGTLTATQGSTTIGTTTETVGSSWTDMTVNTNSGSGGTLSFTYNPTTCAVNIHSITVVYETPAPSHTITAVSNNNSYGTVSLSGSVITASPISGYMVNTSNPYEVTVGSATVSRNGNAFTVTPTTDCTVQINFEAIPTYEVTINALTGGTLSVMNGETPVSTGAKIQDGTVLTITATPDADYNFKNWQAIDASTHTYTASNTGTYTINGHAVTFNANFDAKVYHDAYFLLSGGTQYAKVKTEEGQAIDFPDDPDDVGGRDFVGWVASEIDGTTNTAPTFVTSADMGDADVTYYACYASVNVTYSESEIEMTQTLQYDTWTYSGSTTNKSGYRLFHTGSYIESAAFDLSLLKKVVVYGGTFGGNSYNSLTIGDGTNVWKDVTVSGKSETGENEYTGGTALSGTKALRVISNSGTASGSGTGVRISQVEIYTKKKEINYEAYCTTVSTSGVLNNVNTANYGFATFCAPSNFTITPEENKEVKAYKASLEGTTLTLSEINQEVIPASTGIILAGDKGASYAITYTPSDATAITENDFEGTLVQTAYSDVNASGTKYVLVLNNTTNEFVRFTGNIPANKAYLLYDIPQQGSAPSVRIVFEGNNATSMEEIEATDEAVKFIENGILYIRRAGKTYDAVGRIVK